MRWRSMAVAVFAIGMFAALTAAEPVDTRPICEITAEWVDKNRENLPATLAAFEEFTPSYRRAIASALPNEVRTTLWVEQLSNFASENELTSEQAAFVAKAIASFEAGLVAKSAIEKTEVRALAEESKDLFDFRTLGTTFSVLGSVPDISVFDREDCSCSTYAWGCLSIGLECVGGSEDCRGVEECGVFGLDYCDGICELEN